MDEDDATGQARTTANEQRNASDKLQASFFDLGSSAWTKSLPKTEHVQRFLQTNFGSTLGPISKWGPALRFYTTMLFADSHGACIYWGPERVTLYNVDICEILGTEHQTLMGKPLSLGLPSVWEDVRKIFDEVATTGQTRDVDCIPLFPIRHGFIEETYFVGSFIPLRGDSGEIEGFYNRVVESTSQVLYERRQKVVESLASIPPCSVDETLKLVMKVLSSNPHDITMAMIYSLDEFAIANSGTVRLRGSLSVPDGLRCAPKTADLSTDKVGILFYFRQIQATGSPVVLSQSDGSLQDTGNLFESVEWAGYGEPSRDVVILPLSSGGRLLGFYVQGTNPRRPYDHVTQMTVVDTARQIEARWLASISRDEARLREEMLEQRLTDSERRSRHMAQAAPLGMVQINPDRGGSIEWANDKFYEITGHTRSKPAIADFMNVIAPEDRERAGHDFTALFEEEAPRIASEIRLTRKWTPPVEEDGDAVDNTAWVLTLGFPVFENGQLKLIMGYVSDVSHLKWAESVQTRNAAAATTAKRRQEEFIDVTSHEMRNPLNAILQLADGISKSLDGSDDTLTSEVAYQSVARNNVESANTILSCATHLQRVIDDVLMLSRLESQMLSITPVVASPINVVRKTVKMFDGETALYDTNIEMRKDDSWDSLGVDHVLCDTSRLTQILINLISNAIKFTAPRPERKISVFYGARIEQPPSVLTAFGHLEWMAHLDGQLPGEGRNSALPDLRDGENLLYLYFCVQDTGPGVTSKEVKRLFKRFSQANSKTHISYGGSGLGLYICRQLAEKQGGGVGVASNPGEGSVFGFYIEARHADGDDRNDDTRSDESKQAAVTANGKADLPQRPASAHAKRKQIARQTAAPSSARQAVTETQASQHDGFHILLAEDNLINQKVLANQLKAAKCTVSVANHGEEVLEILNKTHPLCDEGREKSSNGSSNIDVVLMDWEMPVMDGLTCCKRIRALESEASSTGRLPIIAITANVREEQQSQAMAAGMDSVMAKPFTVADLLARIRYVVENTASASTTDGHQSKPP